MSKIWIFSFFYFFIKLGLKLKAYLADNKFMKSLVSLIFCFAFPYSVLAMTLGEIGAATGIANTLQGTATIQPKKILDKTKEAVKEYEDVQKNQLKSMSDPRSSGVVQKNNSGAVSSSQTGNNFVRKKSNLSSQNISPETLKQMTESDLEETFRDEAIYQDVKSVDYKSDIQVFYKNSSCSVGQKNCHRGAVLTNIKSVIFDYAHTRGSFSQSK